jgi:hypothetical protein
MRDIHDPSFAEEYLTEKLHEIDTALERLDRFPDLAIDFEARRRLTQLKAQLTAAVEAFPARETRQRVPA